MVVDGCSVLGMASDSGVAEGVGGKSVCWLGKISRNSPQSFYLCSLKNSLGMSLSPNILM